MKNIFKIIGSLSLLLAIASCTINDKEPIATANGFVMNQPDTGTTYTLTPENRENDLLTLTWEPSNNAIASVPKYTIQIAKSGTNFANPIEAVSSTDLSPTGSYTWKVGYLNTLLGQIGFAPCETLNVDVRIKSTLGIVENNSLVQYSNVVSFSLTPYLNDLPTMAFSADGVITNDTPKLASSGILKKDFEGYMYLAPGSYKFYKPNSCGIFTDAIVYGDDGLGSFNTLVVDGAAYVVATAGFYLVKADLTTNIYSVRLTTWNLFGTAKNFPLANAPMTYDQTTKLWKATVSLTPGYGFKFRSNGSGTNLFVLGNYLASTVEQSEYA